MNRIIKLEQMQHAKVETDRIMEIWNPGHSAAEAALTAAWEGLFDYLKLHPLTELFDLGAISAIIHKLTSSHTRLKSIELRARESLAKIPPLPPSTEEDSLSSLEQKLNLL
ncbi:MAG: hypothetical protein A2007_04485 [Verrucomicrobia bacterium GWC2_42_7]|nr:MAG: hypothetical protein A2007_04485 [Verrucomicrobia bacterium GWC2_42_7]